MGLRDAEARCATLDPKKPIPRFGMSTCFEFEIEQ